MSLLPGLFYFICTSFVLAFCLLSLLYNTHDRNVHATGGIRTRKPTKRSAADIRLRPLGYWEIRPRTFQPVVSRYTDSAIPAHLRINKPEKRKKRIVVSNTSAMTPMQPAMTAALGCAPPSPEVTKTFPARSSVPRYFLPAFNTVIWKQEFARVTPHRIRNETPSADCRAFRLKYVTYKECLTSHRN